MLECGAPSEGRAERMTSRRSTEDMNPRETGTAADVVHHDIEVGVVHEEGTPCATWSFQLGNGEGDATRISLYTGQKYQVTYRLRDASWGFEAVSLRQVTSTSAGFVTLSQGQSAPPHTLPANAGTLTVVEVLPDKIVLDVSNALPEGDASFIVGLSLTVTSLDTPTLPRQSSQDPQMVLESKVPPPPTLA